jgi:hypothetical protein
MSIEYSFVMAIIASISALGVAGLVFGFQMSHWTEWQGIIAGAGATLAGFIGAGLGLRMSFVERMRVRHHSHHHLR